MTLQFSGTAVPERPIQLSSIWAKHCLVLLFVSLRFVYERDWTSKWLSFFEIFLANSTLLSITARVQKQLVKNQMLLYVQNSIWLH